MGQINIDPAMPHAFLSYTRLDDDYLNGGISALRLALEKAVHVSTGEPFRIFQDVDDIKLGDPWREKLDQAIEAAQLFIPVLTPNFFASDFCRREAKAFLDYEARAGRSDLVLPIYLFDTPLMNDGSRDELARRLQDRQYADWRAHRFLLQAEETRSHIHDLAGAIASAVARTNAVEQGPIVPTEGTEEQFAKFNREIIELNEALTVEHERARLLEIELGDRRNELKQLAEERVSFQGQLEEAVAAKGESEVLKKLRERLSLLDQALKKERAKTRTLTKDFLANEDKVEQLTIERTVLEGDAHEVKVLNQRIRRLERQLQQKQDDMDKAAESAGAERETMLGELALFKTRLETFRRDQDGSTPFPEITVGIGRRAGVRKLTDYLYSSFARLREWIGNIFEFIGEAIDNLVTLAIVLLIGYIAFSVLFNVLSKRQVGATFRDCDECPEMVNIPAGEFQMGSPEGEGRENEHPQHKVTISEPFVLGKYEVTFAEWDACVAAGSCDHTPGDQSWGRGDRPVINVSWNDAQQYCGWLSETTGRPYRLPSEAEWEYAARAGSDTAYFWGDEVGKNQANCDGCGSEWDNKQTAPVGSFAPNPFGLFDMHGNVREWVEDTWHKTYEGAPADGRAWSSEAAGPRRVLRGGSWDGNARSLRSAGRDADQPDYRIFAVGFRCARVQE